MSCYFFKTKTLIENPMTQMHHVTEKGRKVFEGAYNRFIKKLEKAEDYNDEYLKGIKAIAKYFNFPNVTIKMLGVSKDYIAGKLVFEPVPIEIVKENKNLLVNSYTQKVEGELDDEAYDLLIKEEKVNNHFILITEEKVGEYIEKVKAMRNLPNKKEVVKTLKHFKSLQEKGYHIYGIYYNM